MSDVAAHWDGVYGTRPADTVSWYEPRPVTSLRLIRDASPLRGPVVDVGAGASFLADALVGDGWEDVTVLDVSAEALEVVRQRAVGRQVVCIATDLSWLTALLLAVGMAYRHATAPAGRSKRMTTGADAGGGRATKALQPSSGRVPATTSMQPERAELALPVAGASPQ